MISGYANLNGQARKVDSREIRGKHGGLFTRVFFRSFVDGKWKTSERDYPEARFGDAEAEATAFLAA